MNKGISEQQYSKAQDRSKCARAAGYAVTARYNRRKHRIEVAISNGLMLAFSPNLVPCLQHAKATDLCAIEISPSGLGLHWPLLDADLYLPGILKGRFDPTATLRPAVGNE